MQAPMQTVLDNCSCIDIESVRGTPVTPSMLLQRIARGVRLVAIHADDP